MFKRMLAGAVFAGCAAGLIGAVLHFVFVQELILLGERYESGALVHSTSGSSPADAAPMAAHGHSDAAGTGHSHGPAAGGGGMSRDALTVLFTVLIYTSYGMLLAAGFALAEGMGRKVGPVEGLLWGLAGYASFQLAPALGLAPELPGTISADLGARQVWWWGTALGTATGLALIAYGRSLALAALGAALILAPHLLGAPMPDAFWGAAPPEVGAMFAARVLGVGLAVWAILGWVLGWLWSRPSLV